MKIKKQLISRKFYFQVGKGYVCASFQVEVYSKNVILKKFNKTCFLCIPWYDNWAWNTCNVWGFLQVFWMNKKRMQILFFVLKQFQESRRSRTRRHTESSGQYWLSSEHDLILVLNSSGVLKCSIFWISKIIIVPISWLYNEDGKLCSLVNYSFYKWKIGFF